MDQDLDQGKFSLPKKIRVPEGKRPIDVIEERLQKALGKRYGLIIRTDGCCQRDYKIVEFYFIVTYGLRQGTGFRPQGDSRIFLTGKELTYATYQQSTRAVRAGIREAWQGQPGATKGLTEKQPGATKGAEAESGATMGATREIEPTTGKWKNP